MVASERTSGSEIDHALASQRVIVCSER